MWQKLKDFLEECISKKVQPHPEELIELMSKHEDERFLFVSYNLIKEGLLDYLDTSNINYTRGIFFKTVSTNLKKINAKVTKYKCN